jgi:outer membrane usher protein
VLAHYAHGFAPALTGGFDVARTATATNVSPSATIATRFGIFAGGLAVSDRGEVGNGLAKIVDYRLTRGGVQFTAHYDDASANYAGAGVDSAALATTTGASRSIGAGIALPLFRRQYVSFNYSTTSQVAGTTSQVNVASTIPFLHRNINVNVAVARGGGVSNYNLGLSSSFRFGKTSGAISSQTGTTGNGIDVSLSHDVENTTGVGYNLDANSTGGINVLGTIEDRTPALLTTLDLFASGAGRPSYALGTSGALLFGGGTVTPTAQLGSSYAVVEAGVPHLRVYLNDQLAGTTDRNGRLVLPSLAAYHDNVVLVEPPAGDLTMTIVDPQRTVNVPASRGAVLRFHVSRSRAAIGTLVYERAGVRTEAKLGTLVVNNADVRFESPLGTDGRFFFESLPAGTYDARAQAPNGTSCAFRLHVPEAATQFVRLGEIACPVNS